MLLPIFHPGHAAINLGRNYPIPSSRTYLSTGREYIQTQSSPHHTASTMALPAFEAQISKAWEDKAVPGAVMLAKSRDGKVDYQKNVGPWDETTVFPLASMTKLVTSIAVAKAIEEGLFALDTDVSPYLPSLAAQPILSGFSEAGELVLRRREKAITLRHLMTHTYGQA